MSAISQWSSSAGGNTAAAPNGWPEGMAPSSVNDCAREMMAATRTWYESAEWIDYGWTPTFATTASFTMAGDRTAQFHAGRRIKCSDATVLYGKISSVTYSTNTRVSVTLDSGELAASLSAVAVGILSFTNQSIPEISATAAYARVAGAITDGSSTIKTKIIDIGDWNMDASAYVTVAHGLTSGNIRTIQALVRPDAGLGDTQYPLTPGYITSAAEVDGWVYTSSDALVYVGRRASGMFDSTAFDSTSYNRGWITITYVE